jgi:ATP-binding cassette subfamily A (ABC1) protein 3
MPSTGGADAEPVNYTIRADAGLYHIDVVKHSSDYEKRILPLQWAIDQVRYALNATVEFSQVRQAVIELRTGKSLHPPLEWPFNQETNEEQSTETRLSYIRGLRTLLVLAL